MNDLRLNIYKSLSSYESRLVGIEEILWWLRSDESLRNKTELYRHLARTVSREEANKKVKEVLVPAFSVAVQLKTIGRQVTHITRVTGLCICDLDHVSNVAEAFERVRHDPHTWLCYHTISGEGLRVIYRYSPADNATAYRAAYRKGNAYYARLCGTDYDCQCGNLTRLSGMAHDPEACYNPEATAFDISDDEAAEANLAADTEPGKPRKEFPAGTHQAEPEAAWAIAEPMLSRRTITYGKGTHHAYVMHASHLMNRFGVALDDMLEWAGQTWADYNAQERDDLIRWVWQHRQAEHGTWRLSKKGRKGEVSMISLPDICRWLRDHQVEVIFNEVTDQTSYRIGDSQPWQQMDDSVVCSLRREMASDTGKRVLKSDVADIIKSNYARRVHPVRDYIKALPKWDGTDRVALLAGHVGVEPSAQGDKAGDVAQLFHWAMHKWLVGMVADWLSDEVSNQTILTLIGQQGIYKTTFFRYLLPPPLRQYFWENSHNSFSMKDDQIALTENCLVDIEEIDMFRDRDNAELKSLATRIQLKVRRPYDKFPVAKHRLASLCATGNQEQFLTDETGDRRWLCFRISSIDKPWEWDLDYDQLYAQLRDEYFDGFQYWFDKSEEQRIQRQNAPFRIVSDEEQLIAMRFRKPRPGDVGVKRLYAAAIAQMLSYGRAPLSSRKVGQVMQKLGFKCQRIRSGSIYSVFEMTPAEQQMSHESQNAKETSENKNVTDEEILPF